MCDREPRSSNLILGSVSYKVLIVLHFRFFGVSVHWYSFLEVGEGYTHHVYIEVGILVVQMFK